jgi:hypothetical protein
MEQRHREEYVVYAPVRQFEQYELARLMEETSRSEKARSSSPLPTPHRAWLAVGALLVMIAIVGIYAVAAST